MGPNLVDLGVGPAADRLDDREHAQDNQHSTHDNTSNDRHGQTRHFAHYRQINAGSNRAGFLANETAC